VRKRVLCIVVMAAIAIAAFGCSRRSTVDVQSDTCWTVTFDNQQSAQDCGNVQYKVIGPLTCVQVRKASVGGTVRVRINSGPWAVTTDSMGVAQVCQ